MAGFVNLYPYSDAHELNLDWLLKQTKENMSAITYLQEEFAKITILTKEEIEAMIELAIVTNNVTLRAEMEAMKIELNANIQRTADDLTVALKKYTNNKITDLSTYVDIQDAHYNDLAAGYAQTALQQANAYTDEKVLTYTMMINPITGEYDDVRDVVDDMITYFHSDGSLTAGEYDALDLTASAYDAYELSAYDYDFNGKNLLV